VRDKPYKNLLPVETINSTFQRILKEANDYIDLDELIDFFTHKGRPLQIEHRYYEQYERVKQDTLKDVWERKDSPSPDFDEIKEKRKQRKLEKIVSLKE